MKNTRKWSDCGNVVLNVNPIILNNFKMSVNLLLISVDTPKAPNRNIIGLCITIKQNSVPVE